MMSVSALSLVVLAAGRTTEADWATFAAWKVKHERTYASEDEEADRFNNFQDTLTHIETRNAEEGPNGAFYAPDEWADESMEDFMAKRTGAKPMSCLQSGQLMSADEVNRTLATHGTEIDWEKKGAVTPVKNQGSFGTCWAFGTTGVMEGMNFVQGGNPLESISEQELVDCSGCGGYVGCCWSKYYIPKHKAASSESSYPYKGRSSSCKASSATDTKSKTNEVICEANGANNDQEHLVAQMVKYGPFAFLVDAGCIHSYANGIISNCPRRPGKINHATLSVGAGTENGVDYFRVKNSWGTGHGEHGYFRSKRGGPQPQLGVPGGIYGVYDSSALV